MTLVMSQPSVPRPRPLVRLPPRHSTLRPARSAPFRLVVRESSAGASALFVLPDLRTFPRLAPFPPFILPPSSFSFHPFPPSFILPPPLWSLGIGHWSFPPTRVIENPAASAPYSPA